MNTNTKPPTLDPVELSLLIGAVRKDSNTLTQQLLTGKSVNIWADRKKLEMYNKLDSKLKVMMKETSSNQQ